MITYQEEYKGKLWTGIEHLGKLFETSNFDNNLSDEECNYIRDNFYKLCDINAVHKQMKKLYEGGKEDSQIYEYWFYQLAAQCKLKGQKWSIHEFIQSNDLLRYASGKVKSSEKVYPPKIGILKNIRTVFRISPSGSAAKLSNFHYGIIKDLLSEYKQKFNKSNENKLNYYDFSSGWGTRANASFAQDVNYFGTDTNPNIISALKEMYSEFQKVTETKSSCDVRNCGSEIFIPEWEGIIDLAFSSPPYFDLEEYVGDEQSIYKFPEYQEWLSFYWEGTVKNIHKYLTKNGVFGVNVKNIKGYDLYEDFKQIILNNGFIEIEEKEVGNINRHSLRLNNKNNEERMMLFAKVEEK